MDGPAPSLAEASDAAPRGPGEGRASSAHRSLRGAMRAGVEAAIVDGFVLPVEGGCMTPVVPAGARVRLERCSPSALRPGDVVLVERAGAFRLHRYLGALGARPRYALPRGRRLLTKADGARRPDRPWPPESLVGKLVGVQADAGARPYRPGLLERLRAAAFGLAWLAALAFLGRAGRR